jgi:hypothetical protein
MRILLANQVPFQGSDSGRQTDALAQSLLAAGHEVRCLIVDSQVRHDDAVPTRRVVCRQHDSTADLPFDFPVFEPYPLSGQTFARISAEQLAVYRDALRQAMDAEVESFNPHVIHAQDIWILGHLALEAGAPYVLSTAGREFAACRLSLQVQRYAEEAAENAGRIIAGDEVLRRGVEQLFGELDGRVVTAPTGAAAGLADIQWLGNLYREVVTERFGAVPEG